MLLSRDASYPSFRMQTAKRFGNFLLSAIAQSRCFRCLELPRAIPLPTSSEPEPPTGSRPECRTGPRSGMLGNLAAISSRQTTLTEYSLRPLPRRRRAARAVVLDATDVSPRSTPAIASASAPGSSGMASKAPFVVVRRITHDLGPLQAPVQGRSSSGVPRPALPPFVLERHGAAIALSPCHDPQHRGTRQWRGEQDALDAREPCVGGPLANSGLSGDQVQDPNQLVR